MTTRQIVLDYTKQYLGQYVEVWGLDTYGIGRRVIGLLLSVEVYSCMYFNLRIAHKFHTYQVMEFYVIHRRREVATVRFKDYSWTITDGHPDDYSACLRESWSPSTRP